jgi:hypothetical protein
VTNALAYRNMALVKAVKPPEATKCSGLACKLKTCLKKLAKDKHSSLFCPAVGDEEIRDEKRRWHQLDLEGGVWPRVRVTNLHVLKSMFKNFLHVASILGNGSSLLTGG